MRVRFWLAAVACVASALERDVQDANNLLSEDLYFEVNCTGATVASAGYTPNTCYPSDGKAPYRRIQYNSTTGACRRGDTAVLYAETETCSSTEHGIPVTIGECTNQHLKVDCLCDTSVQGRYVQFGSVSGDVRCGTKLPQTNVIGTPICSPAEGGSGSTRLTFGAQGSCTLGNTAFVESYPDDACDSYPITITPLNRNTCVQQGDALYMLTCPCDQTRAVADYKLSGFTGAACGAQPGIQLQSSFDGCTPFSVSPTQFYSIMISKPQTCSHGSELNATLFSGATCTGEGVPTPLTAGVCSPVKGYNVVLSAVVECW